MGEFLKAELIAVILHTLIKQSTEQIRRTRLLAANIFSHLLYCDPAIPHIVQREELGSIIARPPLDISTEKECFDLWIRVLDLETYRKSVITGLVSSIGSLTESLVKSSSAPFFAHLRRLMANDETHRLKLIGDDILEIFENNLTILASCLTCSVSSIKCVLRVAWTSFSNRYLSNSSR